MALLTIAYQDRTIQIPVEPEWTGTLGVSLNFFHGVLSRGRHGVAITEARCAECGGRRLIDVTFTPKREAGGDPQAGGGPPRP